MEKIRLIVAGSRCFDDYDLLKSQINEIKVKYEIVEIVSGTARGADRLGELYAKEHNIPVKRFPADWDRYGKAAGYIRNVQMAEYADACICFSINYSRGTEHMINLSKLNKLKLRVVRLDT